MLRPRAIEASAFVESDLGKLVEVGLQYVPEGSKLRGVIELVLESRGLSWVEARGEVLRRFGSPDATSVHQNVGFTLIALLWGNYDFGRTVLIALNSGYDTDCTAATAAAVLGVILGASGLPRKWVEPLKDSFEMGFQLPRESFRISDLAHETCAVGVAASRAVNQRVRIVGVPGRVEELARRIHTGRRLPEVELRVNYVGAPAVGKGEEKELEVEVRNSGDFALAGELKLEVPPGWSAPGPARVVVPPRSSRRYTLRVRGPASGVLWDRNVLRAVLAAGGAVHAKEFGLAGSAHWLLLGPFYDSPGPLTDFADVEKQYVDERLIEEGRELELFKGAVELSSPTSLIPIEKAAGFQGECCFYLLRRLYSPEDRDVFIVVGAQGDVRVWLNGRRLAPSATQGASCIWNPLMHWFPARLRRGENRVVIKYLKRTREPALSFDLYRENASRRPSYSPWQVDLGSILG